MKKSIPLISIGAMLALFAPASPLGILLFVILPVALVGGLLLWKKPDKLLPTPHWYSFVLTIFLFAPVYWMFYNNWLGRVRVQNLAAALHIPPATLVTVVAAALCLCASFIVASGIQLLKRFFARHTGKVFLLVRNLLLCLVSAVFAVVLAQKILGEAPIAMGTTKFIWSVVAVLACGLALYAIIGSVRASVVVSMGLVLLLAIANSYVFRFRTRLIEPVDIFSLGTAMNVADNYSLLPISPLVWRNTLWWLGLMLLMFWVIPKGKFAGWKTRVPLALSCIVCVVSVGMYSAGLQTYHWQKEGLKAHGMVLDFTSKIKELSPEKPETYDEVQLRALAEQYAMTGTGQEDTPHIIVIMNEAFSDLTVLGEFGTNMEVTPFISSLKENTISGYALASVFGGNTANSEFEFLTGNSMAWLSPNAVPYQQYFHQPAYSMVSHLKNNYNYHCVAMHPYLSSGWNRPQVYQQMGFDTTLFQEAFPQDQQVRCYISDQAMYDKIIETYEQRSAEPLFLFGVTMQNHGGYTYQGPSPADIIQDGNLYFDVNQYLSLLHESDKAVKNLITYFEQAEEDVVIVFFGDHQPQLNDAFYQDFGNYGQTLEDIQARYKVPFFVWTNYDIEEKQVECTSLNYLSTYVYEAAGLPLPSYNRFLADMEQTIPAINANGFYSATGGFVTFEEATEEELQWLQKYELLQYNCLFDNDQRNKTFFPTVNE